MQERDQASAEDLALAFRRLGNVLEQVRRGTDIERLELEPLSTLPANKSRTIIANYAEQRSAFESLLQPDCRKSILFFRGEGGSGKTTLLKTCLERVPSHITSVPIQLRGSAVGVSEVFYRIIQRLGEQHFTRFIEQIANLLDDPRIQIDNNWLASINNRISMALRAESPADQEHRLILLTAAWFQDLANLDHLLLIVLDTYEQASQMVANWIDGPFLARAAENPRYLRVVLAGQTVPNPMNIEWGDCCTVHELYGVPEANHWLPVIEALDRHIPFGEPLVWLTGVCYALKGHPSDMMKIIEDLPHRGVEA